MKFGSLQVNLKACPTAPPTDDSEDDVAEDDLDCVDADENVEYEAFLEELYSPSD